MTIVGISHSVLIVIDDASTSVAEHATGDALERERIRHIYPYSSRVQSGGMADSRHQQSICSGFLALL